MLGGVATAVETLRRTLRALGHQPVVVAPGRDRDGAGGDVIRVPAVPAPTYPDFLLPLPLGPRDRQRLAALRLDVVHAHHPFLLGGAARRLARGQGLPLLFTYHTRYDKYAHYVPLPPRVVGPVALAWGRRFAGSADHVIAPSEAVAGRLRDQGLRTPVTVLPTGIDVGHHRPGDRAGARRHLGLPAGVPLVLYVGRLDREKNLDLLLDAFDLLAAREPRARLLLVGRGTREPALRARAGAGAARVVFAGGVPPDQVVRYYQAADLFAFASTTETQGLAVLEAMAAGLPVVAVRATGVEEAIHDGVSGLLVPEHPAAFAAAVGQALADPGLAAKLGAGARERAAAFGTDVLGPRLVALYRAVAGRR
jgi:glycosyltransferase involved in cell wall biosynthesis